MLFSFSFSGTLKSNVRKGLHLFSMLVFAVFFSSIFFVDSAFAASTPLTKDIYPFLPCK